MCEFENRIRKIASRHYGSTDFLGKQSVAVALNEVREIFNEVKQKFPDYDKIMVLEGEEFDGEEYDEMHEGRFIFEVSEWFVKWFK